MRIQNKQVGFSPIRGCIFPIDRNSRIAFVGGQLKVKVRLVNQKRDNRKRFS